MMSGIKGRNTTPELVVRRYLHAAGLRFRVHAKTLPGKPDIVVAKYRSVVLVHGCFWHRHPGCKFATIPSTRTDAWLAKFDANMRRDDRDAAALGELGWNVLTIWECETRDATCLDRLFWRIAASLGPQD